MRPGGAGGPDRDAPPHVADRLASLLGARPVRWTWIEGGYTPAQRWCVELDDGRRVFAKRAVESFTVRALEAESIVYRRLSGPFMPGFLGWHEDAANPLLLIEWIDDATTPPPWDDERIDGVLEALSRLHMERDTLAAFEKRHVDLGFGWASVERDPVPFLSLGHVTRGWLDKHLPALVAAEGEQRLSGAELGHFDLRSDNILFAPDRTVLVDWSAACHGPPELDIGLWLPSLHAEGGPPPEAILPEAGDTAAWVSGFFAARAGLAELPHAPRVRGVQREQLGAALPWVVRELGLGEPDGPEASGLLKPE